MRVPVPTNRLVAFTLAGALLTAVVAGGLAFPGLIPGVSTDSPGDATSADTDATQRLAADAPEPNQDFTPDVQTQSSSEEHEEEEYEDEHDEEEHEEHGDDEREEHEEYEADETHGENDEAEEDEG
jgi:hypothetical protein